MADRDQRPDRTLAEHWDSTYAQGDSTRSWFEPEPTMSVRMLDQAGLRSQMSVIDVGGGTSRLVDVLLDRGHRDVVVLDVSETALAAARQRLGSGADHVTWVHADVQSWPPPRRLDVWHDRAVLHFLTTPADQSAYLATLRAATHPGSIAAIGCFAPDGPLQCSGLPVVRYSAEELDDLLGDDWSLTASERELHATPTEQTQAFTWATFVRLSA